MPEPFASQMEEKYGAVPIANLDAGATQQFPVEGYAVTRAWAAAHRNTLRAFLAALRADSRSPTPTGRPSRRRSLMALNTYPLGVDATRIQRVANAMQQFGLLKEHFDVRVMLG